MFARYPAVCHSKYLQLHPSLEYIEGKQYWEKGERSEEVYLVLWKEGFLAVLGEAGQPSEWLWPQDCVFPRTWLGSDWLQVCGAL